MVCFSREVPGGPTLSNIGPSSAFGTEKSATSVWEYTYAHLQ
jgi:hypothetical protein